MKDKGSGNLVQTSHDIKAALQKSQHHHSSKDLSKYKIVRGSRNYDEEDEDEDDYDHEQDIIVNKKIKDFKPA